MASFISGYVMKAASSVTEMLGELFKYNRENFQQDRKQRMAMEYKVMDMRVEQVDLWRKDVRDLMEFSLDKLEVYLLVSTLELGFTVTAYVKSRVPEGGPSWLVSAHLIALTASFMYLLLSLWLGIHAYVASVAYKVRILTQHVRLPVPTWDALEAARTYGSAFEKMPPMQMFRVPILVPQEKVAAADAKLPVPPSAAEQLGGAAANLLEAAADPWRLERRGDDISELAPDVNSKVAKQRHIWLARQAASLYQTHEAFSRVTLSLGTSYLSQFLCYHCLGYTLLENGAAIAAFAGVFAFSAVSVGMMWLDISLTNGLMIILSVLNLIGPILSSVAAFMNSKYYGYPGAWDYLVPVAMLSHGVWLLAYLVSLRIRETEMGAVLPMAFRGVLYIDVFAHHRDATERPPTASTRESGVSVPQRRHEGSSPALSMSDQGTTSGLESPCLPAISCVEESKASTVSTSIKPHNSDAVCIFVMSTVMLALVYISASAMAVYNAVAGMDHLGVYGQPPPKIKFITEDISQCIASGKGERIETAWPSALARPHGLACDATGLVFAVAGQAATGRKALLHGRLAVISPSTSGSSNSQNSGLRAPFQAPVRHQLRFNATAACPHSEGTHGLAIQDVAVHGCSHSSGCVAVVLPREGRHLVTCALNPANATAAVPREPDATPLARNWLENGAALGGGHADTSRAAASEELTSLAMVPCDKGDVFVDHSTTPECAIVGTSAHRVVRMAPVEGPDLQAIFAPRHFLTEGDRQGDKEVSGPGVFAKVGTRYLGVLHRKSNSLHLLDFEHGGVQVGVVRLPPSPRRAPWAAVCAGGGSIYALEPGEDPAIWRFSAPAQLH